MGSATISDLKFDKKNANKHTEKGMRLLEKSLQKNGAGRSILLDKDNNIIAGNGVVEVAGQIGFDKVKIVETDGTEIIAVKRVDVSINTGKGRAMAIADNQIAKVGIDLDVDIIDDLSKEYGINYINEWELFDNKGLLATNFNDDKYMNADRGLPFPLTIIVTEDDYNRWVKIKDGLKIKNDRDAFLKILGNL